MLFGLEDQSATEAAPCRLPLHVLEQAREAIAANHHTVVAEKLRAAGVAQRTAAQMAQALANSVSYSSLRVLDAAGHLAHPGVDVLEAQDGYGLWLFQLGDDSQVVCTPASPDTIAQHIAMSIPQDTL